MHHEKPRGVLVKQLVDVLTGQNAAGRIPFNQVAVDGNWTGNGDGMELVINRAISGKLEGAFRRMRCNCGLQTHDTRHDGRVANDDRVSHVELMWTDKITEFELYPLLI